MAASSLDSRHFRLDNVWKDAPLLKGEIASKPSPYVKNILITGGAGFMYVLGSTATRFES